jgi:cytochrome c
MRSRTLLVSAMLCSVATIGLGYVRPFGNQRSDTAEAAAGDAERGKAAFNRRCTSCHALDANREGPRLRGVFGRKAGSVPGFKYSAPLKASGIIWDKDSLDRWLSDTDVMIADNAMGFRVVKASERQDLIAYLRQSK